MKRLLTAAVLSMALLNSSLAQTDKLQKKIEERQKKELKCPSSFLKNPPVYFYCIYSDYHNHRYEEGIEKTNKALEEIEPLYRENPNATVPNATKKEARLKRKKIYQVKSDLLMLKGMLEFKKSLTVNDGEAKKLYESFYKKLQKRGFDFVQINELMNLYMKSKLVGLNEKEKKQFSDLKRKMKVKESELDNLFMKAKEASDKADKERLKYLSAALRDINEAVKVDPENALAHYQLGNIFSGIAAESEGESSEAAESAYYRAAVLFKKQGDTEAYKEIIKRLKQLNPNSKYLKKLGQGKDA